MQGLSPETQKIYIFREKGKQFVNSSGKRLQTGGCAGIMKKNIANFQSRKAGNYESK